MAFLETLRDPPKEEGGYLDKLLSMLLGSEYSLLGKPIKEGMERTVESGQPTQTPRNAYEYLTGYPKKDWMLANMAMAAGKMMPTGTPMMKQIEAYHGSPHKFDKFSTKQIGTGEGAQAFGWGLYFTDKPNVARHYSEQFKDITAIKPKNEIDEYIIGKAQDYIDEFGSSPERKTIEDWIKQDEPENFDMFDALDRMNELYDSIEGNVYKVALHKGKEPGDYDYLRWDKPPTSEQLNKIKKQFRKEGLRDERGIEEYFKQSEGRDLSVESGKTYRALKNVPGINSDKGASLFLLRAGIDGIKYPAGTLSGGTKDNAFNYVVFDENAVDIDKMERY